VSGSLVGNESSSYNRNRPKSFIWVLIFGREGNNGTSITGTGKSVATHAKDQTNSKNLYFSPLPEEAMAWVALVQSLCSMQVTGG